MHATRNSTSVQDCDLQMKKFALLALCAAALSASGALSTVASAAGDAAAGKAKAAACVACHNADGNSTNPEWPKLAGQNAKYIAKQLRDLKTQEARKNPIMMGMTAALSDKDMDDLGAYFAIQSTTGGFVSEDRVKQGEQIFRGGNASTGVPACAACHGPAGTGNPDAGIPSLSGQHAKYTATQLQAFRSGTRSNDLNAMMRGAARWLSDEEIAAVSEYVSALH